MNAFSQNINPPPHYPRPLAPSAPPRATGQFLKEISQAIVQIKLMRLALDRTDRDFELTGTVSCETMEFIRSLKGLIA